jgi:group I intron endonuclease
VNKKKYVGSSIDIRKRIRDHYNSLKDNKHYNAYLQKAWNKYGESNFKFSKIEECSKEKLIEREQFWLDKLQTYRSDRGYNICYKADSTLGVKCSEEKKQKISKANTGRQWTEQQLKVFSDVKIGHKNSFYGKHHSIETK